MSGPTEQRERASAGGRLPRVGHLGPAGTFTEEALLASAATESLEPVALASIRDTIFAVRDGEVDWAVAPIENSLEGSISVTLDLLVDEWQSVEILGEALLVVHHALIAAEELALADIDTVFTHPQVPGQCTRFLREQLPGARILAASSTAEAVRAVVSAGQRGHAAIGTELAASIYGGAVLHPRIEDRGDNETRFVWLGPRRVREGAARWLPLRVRDDSEWKTSLVFWGAGAERAGWLVRCLDEFARRAINLTKIESRPRRQRMGNYMFFADLAGSAREEPVEEAIAGLRKMCEEVLVLGSYRRAPALAASARS
jgi:prephenate dehydratase